jgi:hypothetical protein
MRVVYPIKYYKDEGFVERKIEIDEEDLSAIIEEYLRAHGDFEFDEIEIVNNRPMNIWLHAKCRKYIDADDPDQPEDEQISKAEAEVQVSGKYDDNK